jgi:hypothetical protein
MEPPGCTTAVAPASATAPVTERKNASDAATDPQRVLARSLRFHPGDLAASTPTCSAPMASRSGRWRGYRSIDVRADAPRKSQRLPSTAVGCRFRHDTQP